MGVGNKEKKCELEFGEKREEGSRRRARQRLLSSYTGL